MITAIIKNGLLIMFLEILSISILSFLEVSFKNLLFFVAKII